MPEDVLDAAHVIAVMVRAQDDRRFEAMRFKRFQHRTGITRVDDGHPFRRLSADQPYIVVLKGADV
jgi:hypothetical protein